MSRNSLFSVITFGFLAIATTGCGGDTPKPTKSDAPQAAAPASNFSQPVVAGTGAAAEAKTTEIALKPADELVAGLLPASDSDTVVRSTAKGRTDPFSGVVLQTVIETKSSSSATPAIKSSGKSATSSFTPRTISISTTAPALTTPSKLSKSSSALGAASVATLAKKHTDPISKKPSIQPIAIKPVAFPGGSGETSTPAQPNAVAIRNIPVAPAPIPQPELAKAIWVSGVSQVNGQTQVIVKLPNESFSRYVSVGERLMDGKVLVKRVQEFSGLAPVVILEEVGIEVSRKIGDKPMIAANDETKK